jgi:cytochrome subunit of sulfide dehydrogenase
MYRLHKSPPLLAGIAVLLTLSQTSLAAPPAGQLLAAQCAQCHGTNGAGPGFDDIDGESAGELFHELLEMKNRRVESIMDKQARGYTDAQLLDIANYLSGQSTAATIATTNTVSDTTQTRVKNQRNKD